MKNVEIYYKNTENNLPEPLVEKFINMNIKPQNAIDLGCGAGRNTRYLIKNGWNVLSIDKENVEYIISSKLNQDEIKKFRFSKQDFESIKLEKNNLVIAMYSLPFCNNKYFKEFWYKITDAILKERILCWQFFWIER